MRNNPYYKNLKDHLPLFMQGPRSISALNASSEQKNFVEKTMTFPKKIYQVKGVPFTMISPPVLNQNLTLNHHDIVKVEMGQTEVTQELFQAVMGWNRSVNKTSLQNPVETVTWYDCISFCNKLSNLSGFEECYKISDIEKEDRVHIVAATVTWSENKNGFRLPTENEWELFAKAGTNNQWSGTNNWLKLGEYAWYQSNAVYETHPVGKKLPNEWDLYDMSGNVWEWCWDPYDSTNTEWRIVRGGAFWNNADDCGVANRDWFDDSLRDNERGFRLCRSLS